MWGLMNRVAAYEQIRFLDQGPDSNILTEAMNCNNSNQQFNNEQTM
jgi:hypothetical protein